MIYANVELTVEDRKTVANKNIVLYRGDKNVEIRFMIKGNRFVVLESTRAQMIIRRPSTTSIFSEIVPIENDTVIFKITAEMIDELKEIGEYAFQIRLYDDEMNARATLPPCEGCLIINQPIEVESIVNAAMINESVVLASETDEEETFDENNSYNKTEWMDGDIITDARMNKIENALWTNTNDILGLEENYATKDELEEAINGVDVTEQLKDYAKKTDIPSVPTKTSELTNDSGYLTSVPNEYVDETELQTHTDQVLSAGEQLVLNGNQVLQNNYNFSTATYDGSVANNSGGSLLAGVGKRQDVISDLYFSINSNKPLYASLDVKGEVGSNLYTYIGFYDIDKLGIAANHVMYQPNTLTRLAKDIKKGDTVVYLEDLTNWKETESATYRRGFIVWNYTNSKGYTYPPETYSRNVFSNLYTDSSSVDKVNKTITLSTAWTKETIPAGTYLSQGNNGNNYRYMTGSTIKVTTDWKTITHTYNGIDHTGTNIQSKIPPGTAYGKFCMMVNHNNITDEKVWVTNITVKEDIYSTRHTHDNKSVLDGITSAKISAWDNKLSSVPSEYVTDSELNAKGYATEAYVDNVIGENASIAISDTEPTDENVVIWIDSDDDETINLTEIDDSSTSTSSTWSSNKIDIELDILRSEMIEIFSNGNFDSGGGDTIADIPKYHYTEVGNVVKKIIQLKEQYPNHIVFGTISDNHVDLTNEDTIKSAKHGSFGMYKTGLYAQCDFIANLGDNIVGTNIDSDEQYSNFKYMEEITQYNQDLIPFFNLVGNHCKSSNTQKIYDVIGKYNSFDNYGTTQIRGFGYKDFADKKVRAICLNTCDYWNIAGGNGMSYEQKDFLMKALDLSSKSDYASWTIVILSHIPLDFLGGDYNKGADLKAILKAYDDGTTASITVNSSYANAQNEGSKYSGTLTYNYAGKNTPKVINIHGHVHTNTYGNLVFIDDNTTLKMVRMSTSNSNFNQNASTDRYTDYGNYSITTAEANKIAKYRDCAKDTSVTFYFIDLNKQVIHAIGYGADIDRQLVYADATKYTVTYSLTDVSSSSNVAQIIEGESYSTTLSVVDSDYAIDTVKVTMGGTDITSSAYSNGKITISSVTGNIVITATAKDNYIPVWDIANRTAITNVYEDKTKAHACVTSRKNYIVGISDTGIIDYRKVTNVSVNGNDVTFTIPEVNNYNIGLPYQLEPGSSYTFKATASLSARLRVAVFDNTGKFVEGLNYSSNGTNLTLTFTAPTQEGYWTVIMLDGRTAGQTTTFSNISIKKN